MKKIIINICFILIALTAVASVCACDANNCTEEVDLSGNNVGNIIDIGSPIFFSVENTDGCHWVVSECYGAWFESEDSYGSVTKFYFYATSRVGIVKIDLVNSNGEVIDTRVTEWDTYNEYEDG